MLNKKSKWPTHEKQKFKIYFSTKRRLNLIPATKIFIYTNFHKTKILNLSIFFIVFQRLRLQRVTQFYMNYYITLTVRVFARTMSSFLSDWSFNLACSSCLRSSSRSHSVPLIIGNYVLYALYSTNCQLSNNNIWYIHKLLI